MTISTDQEEVIEFLMRRESYGSDVRHVERYETHGALVFLAGDRAYKLKRAVKFSYMDYSTVEQRKAMCQRELEVNRRTAPMLYLDVLPIIKERGALRFGNPLRPETRAVDWVVRMRRFEQGDLLEAMRASGSLSAQCLRRVAETIADFHRAAEITRDHGGDAEMGAVLAEIIANVGTGMHLFGADRVSAYETQSRRAFSDIAGLLNNRRAEGYVRRCHGDLHLNNICMFEGEPVLFDAIEFNDRFACIDVLYDLAFLLMDLDRHDLRPYANTVLNRYFERTGDYAGLSAMPFFLSCRAAIRAHTTLARVEAGADQSEKNAHLKEAVFLLERSLEYVAKTKPRLIAIGGLSGTGKTTLGYGLAPLIGAAPGALVIRSDVIRKQLMGVSETERLPESAYTPEITRTVYGRIAEIAATTLKSGYAAIVDAVYAREDERRAIEDVATKMAVEFDGLWLEAQARVLEERIRSRLGDASDATVEVLHAQLGFATNPLSWKGIDAGGSIADTIAKARSALGC